MAQNHTFLKIKADKEPEAYTTLTGALASESLLHLYATAGRVIHKEGCFKYVSLTIKRIKLNHQTHKK
jgi:hypothetical protein